MAVSARYSLRCLAWIPTSAGGWAQPFEIAARHTPRCWCPRVYSFGRGSYDFWGSRRAESFSRPAFSGGGSATDSFSCTCLGGVAEVALAGDFQQFCYAKTKLILAGRAGRVTTAMELVGIFSGATDYFVVQ